MSPVGLFLHLVTFVPISLVMIGNFAIGGGGGGRQSENVTPQER